VLALLSVSDKRGLVPFARGLVESGFTLLSTGGTLDALTREGVTATPVSKHTGSPEILDGRVKTLHPKIHGGILGRPTLASDQAQMDQHGIAPIAVVAVNLYPFKETVAKGAAWDEVVENIDIGGPAMVRAAAKNSAHVAVIVDPDDYPAVLAELKENKEVSLATRKRLMLKAYAHTAAYDAAISGWLAEQLEAPFGQQLAVGFEKDRELRYGENPHQRGTFYRSQQKPRGPTVGHAQVLQGKELSYNNLLDLDAALGLVLEFPTENCAVVIKHNTPCGVAVGQSLEAAYRTARACDETSAFGGIVAVNREVDAATARAFAETFLEAIIAPGYSAEAREIMAAKKNVRLLEAGPALAKPDAAAVAQLDLRSISGGVLVMDRDALEPKTEWKVVSKRQPSADEFAALRFAWKVCKHVKSNAIVFSDQKVLLAQAGGQTSRVDSVKIAADRGGEKLKGSAAASDAFFPFRDGLDALARAGARCVVQPGGSMRDAEVIAAADEHDLAMVFTGVRHFRH
jgi:phosphoribosylaminoimidazolecarboxamide formyltransferase / IMP cyclohydrolase